MASRKELPNVVIVGRTNVGKSTLFNRLSTEVKSIAYNQEGVTRDFITDIVTWKDHTFRLTDTGGMTTKKVYDQLDKAAQEMVKRTLETADVLLFVCDGTIGVLPEDREIASRLRTYNAPILLLINKIDSKKMYDEHSFEFERLGFKTMIPVSAEHGVGLQDILNTVVDLIPEKEFEKEVAPWKVVLLGKPNVGKSSLMNLLLGQERSIVADIPGTTRESIVEHVTFYKQDLCLVDTAGVRKKRSVNENLEQLMVKSTLHAVREADIVLLLVDASEGVLSDQELKLAYYVFQEQHKALIILFNKQDKVDGYAKSRLESSLSEYEDLMKKVETLSISCKTQKNIGRILPLIQKVAERHNKEFPDDELSMLFKEFIQIRPIYRQGIMLGVRRVQQINHRPMTFAIYTNTPRLYLKAHENFFDNQMRKKFVLTGVPIKFVFRK